MFSVNIDVHESVPQSSVEITNSNRASVCLITKKEVPQKYENACERR